MKMGGITSGGSLVSNGWRVPEKVVYKITKLACQNSDPSFISLRRSTGLLLCFTSLCCILPQLNLWLLCSPLDIKIFFCHFFIKGEYSLIELSVGTYHLMNYQLKIEMKKVNLEKYFGHNGVKIKQEDHWLWKKYKFTG